MTLQKLEISKADITTGEEIAGAQMEIWTADADGNPITKYAEWTTGQDGYDAMAIQIVIM